MSEYIIQGETLSALADEVRTLSGVTDKLTTEEIKTNINTANGVIGDQADLLAQLKNALENKTAHEGGEDVSAETTEYTAQLDELEAAIDALPEAGGGGVNLIHKTGNCNFTIETMYEPGSDLCNVTFDDTSINLSKCVELYMNIRSESTYDRYSEIFMRNTKSIGGKFDRLHNITSSSGMYQVSSWPNSSIDEVDDDHPIWLLCTSGYSIAEITYEALMVE